MNVLVTGASSGLGQQLREVFQSAGHYVVGTTHDKDAVSGNMFYYEITDAFEQTDPGILARKVAACFAGEPVDVLINNAGMNAICEFENLTPKFVRSIMSVNFEAPVFIIQALLPYFRKPGVVVNVISDAAWRPMRHSLAYNCSKAALDMATKQMARELTKPHQLTVLGIRPGKMSNTKMSDYIDVKVQEMRGWTPYEAKKYFQQNSVSGLELHPHDVARLILNIVDSGLVHQLSGACLDLVG